MELEDIRAQFASLQKKRLGPRFTRTSTSDRVIEDWALDVDFFERNEDPELFDLFRRLTFTAKLFVIARDQGMDRAMLFKLQHTG